MSAKKRGDDSAELAVDEMPPSLSQVQAELEVIIEQLEDDDTGLEKSIELYERGSRLVAAANKVLAEAEQRVRVLTEGDDEATADEAG
ncbi:MAG: exodeoxyribonuclease VII small subunit [Halieaceae bacterium]|nr:exodeoxyribonuclease VII small subunit [Halieaceae bacterium]